MELAGAIAELAHNTLKHDFRNIDTTEAEIVLLKRTDRILPPYPPALSAEAEEALHRLGVRVRTKTLVTKIEGDTVAVREGEKEEEIKARTVLWAAGVKASKLGQVLGQRAGAQLDRVGRVIVEPDLSVGGYGNIFVIGDLANYSHQEGKPLPGIAPVAMQEGEYVAKLIKERLKGNSAPAFRYVDTGSLAVIGRNAAVVDLGYVKLSGFLAWLIWVFVHIYFLIEFDNKLVVMLQWGWNYFTRKGGARLITGDESVGRIAVDEGGNYSVPVGKKEPVEV